MDKQWGDLIRALVYGVIYALLLVLAMPLIQGLIGGLWGRLLYILLGCGAVALVIRLRYLAGRIKQ